MPETIVNLDKFISLVENKIGQGQDLEVNRRAKKFVDSIVEALDIIALKKKFRIPKVWEGKQWFSDDIRSSK